MDTNILTPKSLFQKDILYVIPPYQRPYVWEGDDRWAPLWEDVQTTAERYLENLDKFPDDESKAEEETTAHFLGAVVLQQKYTASREVERRIVVDGQQRITTLQLLLDAVQEVFAELNLHMNAKRLAKLVLNDEIFSGTDRFKISPSEGDRDAFKHAMQNGLATDDYQGSLIVQAHEYFQAQTREWLSPDHKDSERRADALEATITALLKLVVIDLGKTDDPHVIFETLNARGTPLLQSDLIKNFVISKASIGKQETIWGRLGDDWWREEVQQGRLRLPRIEVLTNYWLVMKTASEVSSTKLFNEFRRHAESKDISVIVKDMNYVLNAFRDFDGSSDLNTIEALFRYRLKVMQAGVVTPVLLLLLSSDNVSRKDRNQALRALESYLVRRMICRLTTKDYNSVITALLKILALRGLDKIGATIAEFLKGQEAEARIWPTDADIYQSIANLRLYRLLTRGRLRLVLEGMERQIRVQSLGKAEDLDVPPRLSIEHVMPRGWDEENWPLPEKDNDDAIPKEIRDQMVDTLGNLTLTTQRLNSSLSNAPWHEKSKILRDHSVLFLNKELSQRTIWNEESIKARGKELAEVFTQVWPGPDSPEWA